MHPASCIFSSQPDRRRDVRRAALASVGAMIVALAGCKDDPRTTSQAPAPQTAAATQPVRGGRYWQVTVVEKGRPGEVMVWAEDEEGAVRRAEEMRYSQIERHAVRLATPAEVQKHKEMLRLIEQSKPPPTPRPPGGARSGPIRDPWAGFDVGSWVIIHEKQVADGKVEERKVKLAIAEYRPDSPWVSETPEVGGEFGGDSMNRRVHFRGVVPGEAEVAAIRKETLTIGGRQVECTVNEHVQESERTGRKKLVVWRAAGVKVPYREIAASGPDIALDTDVVKAEYSFKSGDASGVYTAEVTRFDEKIKVGDKEVSCVVEKGTGREEGGRVVAGEVTRWLSDDVPGREVRFVGKATVDGKVYEPEKRVVDFKAIKRSE